MSARELVALGTASMVPTRRRAHQATVLRWDDEVVLLDPCEGTQRQLTLAGVSAAAITRVCLTHLHGDHCLGLPGVLQRMVLDGVVRPVDLYFPASGLPYGERLLRASAAVTSPEVRLHPVSASGLVDEWNGLVLSAAALDHRVETFGWRLQEPDGRRMVPEALVARGIAGPAVGELQRPGSLVVRGRRVALEEVSRERPGQSFAFVMDTRWCDGALELASGVDLLVTEATYLDGEEELADRHGHLTAGQAGRLAARAGARRLVLTHYSARHPDEEPFARDARRSHHDVHAAHDLDVVPVPRRS